MDACQEAASDQIMPRPWKQVEALYARYPQTRPFAEDVLAHIRTGYVIDTPEYFIMGRGVRRDADSEDIRNPLVSFPRHEQDTWLVWAFAGTSQNFLTFVPYPLTWVSWSRRNGPLRFHKFDRLCSKIQFSSGEQIAISAGEAEHRRSRSR